MRLSRMAAGVAATSLLTVLGPVHQAHGASDGSLYTYDLRSSTGVVENTASQFSGTSLALAGSWTSDASGTTFFGNLTTQSSVGYAKPVSGSTISVPSTKSVGAAAQFVFQMPVGATCFADSLNIAQIGLYSAGTSQVKLQLSGCGLSKTQVFGQCRVAGNSTPGGNGPVTTSVPLVAGRAYILDCAKSADPGTGTPTVTLRTTTLDSVNGNSTVAQTVSIPKTGVIQTTKYLSIGNKYPVGALAHNTDQFIGTVAKATFCTNDTVALTQACLDQEMGAPPPPPPPTGVDEVKYSFGDTPDTVAFSWRGNETTIYYGEDETYGHEATAQPSAITPVDITGPFMDATLTGLMPGVRYHYRIGADGQDNIFTAAPAVNDSFTVVAVGDTVASTCSTTQTAINELTVASHPDFVIHHGDISTANDCGQPAVHQFYQDIQGYSRSAAFMPVWGNHEYGPANASAPAGTPRDTLANYKGREVMANAQTVPGDTLSKTTNPGCGQETGSTVNTCRGEDWGWFRAGRVLFISFPSTWVGAIADWQVKVTPLMQQAQSDPDVDFIVTYGHHPTLSSTGWTAPVGYVDAFAALGDLFSPQARAHGKYVLNVTGHRHTMEAFPSYHGVTQIVNGGGGQGLINFQTPLAESAFRMKHLGFSTLRFDADAHQLTLHMICGPSSTAQTSMCVAGDTVYSQAFTRG